jgi:hypothetical protein
VRKALFSTLYDKIRPLYPQELLEAETSDLEHIRETLKALNKDYNLNKDNVPHKPVRIQKQGTCSKKESPPPLILSMTNLSIVPSSIELQQEITDLEHQIEQEEKLAKLLSTEITTLRTQHDEKKDNEKQKKLEKQKEDLTRQIQTLIDLQASQTVSVQQIRPLFAENEREFSDLTRSQAILKTDWALHQKALCFLKSRVEKYDKNQGIQQKLFTEIDTLTQKIHSYHKAN